MTKPTLLNVSVRIDHVTLAHVTISVFQGMAYANLSQPLHTYTRGLSGTLTIGRDAAPEFIARLQPVQISARDREEDPFVTEGFSRPGIIREVESILATWVETQHEHSAPYDSVDLDSALSLLLGEPAQFTGDTSANTMQRDLLRLHTVLVNIYMRLTGKIGLPVGLSRLTALALRIQTDIIKLLNDKSVILILNAKMAHTPICVQGTPQHAAEYLDANYTLSMLLERAFDNKHSIVPYRLEIVQENPVLSYMGRIDMVTAVERVTVAQYNVVSTIRTIQIEESL